MGHPLLPFVLVDELLLFIELTYEIHIVRPSEHLAIINGHNEVSKESQ